MINWLAFVNVAVVTLFGAGFVVTMYSLGVRFTAVSGDDSGGRHTAAKIGAYVCFGFCVLAVLAGIILIVPVLSETAAKILGIG